MAVAGAAGGGNSSSSSSSSDSSKSSSSSSGAPPFSVRPYVVEVERGKRHRVRLIGAMSSWTLKVAFASHAVDVIALDGAPVSVVRGQRAVLTPGERADVVLRADAPVGNYWIDVATLDGRNSPAVLRYKGAPDPLASPEFLRTMRPSLPGGCASGKGEPGVFDSKNATGVVAAKAPSVPVPPQGPADKTLTLYMADAAATDPPLSFLRGGNGSGSGSSAGAAVRPRRGAPSCPPPPGGVSVMPSKYCWSINWRVAQGHSDGDGRGPLAILDPSTDGGADGGGPNGARPASSSSLLSVDVAQDQVVDLLLINPSRMVHPHAPARRQVLGPRAGSGSSRRFWVLAQVLGPRAGSGSSRRATAPCRAPAPARGATSPTLPCATRSPLRRRWRRSPTPPSATATPSCASSPTTRAPGCSTATWTCTWPAA